MSANGCPGNADVTMALATLALLFEPSDVIEIRALGVGRSATRGGIVKAGYFERTRSNAIQVALRSVCGCSEGIYVVLNQFRPDLLARCSNHLEARPRHLTGDSDVIALRWLYIDIDPVRPAGISATDSEHRAALERASEIRDFLVARGWPVPILADSGNGGHLLCRLPSMNLQRGSELVKRCLAALAARFSDSRVVVDVATANPSRICKLYGTVARKGDSTAERRHRQSRLIDVPEPIGAVPLEMLEALAVEPPSTATKSIVAQGVGTGLGDWLLRNRIETLSGPEPYNRGNRWILSCCPFNAEHQRPAVIEMASGARVFKCLHTSCSGNDWHAFRTLMEGPDSGRLNVGAVAGSEPANGFHPVRLSELVKRQYEPVSYIWDKHLTKATVSMIAAKPKVGKGTVARNLSLAVSRGEPFLGMNTEKGAVIYLALEEREQDVRDDFLAMGATGAEPISIHAGITPSDGITALIEMVRAYRPCP